MTIFLQTLKAQHFLDNIHITIAQIGSRKSSGADDYSSQSWGIFAPNLTIYGFEADADECKRMNQNLKERNIRHQEKHIPIALSNTQGKSQLYVTKEKMCSSLYEPNHSYVSRFTNFLPEFITIDYVSEIETTTLDSFCASELIDTIDFLQVDVQGAELNIFQGAQQIIKNSTLAIQTEVEFAPIYKNQPLFADVDNHLRQQGFFLQELKELVWMSKKSFPGLGYNKSSLPPELKAGVPQHFSGQLLWGDAFYFQDLLSQPSPVSPEKLLKQACIADILYFPDYALELLEYLTVNYGSNPQYNFTEVINIGLSILRGNTSNNIAELTIPQSNIPNQGSAAQHKLKIGYVSPDFKRHPVGKFIAPIIKHHDHQKFEIYCYGEIRKVDEITEEIQSSCDHWRSTLGLTDAEVIEQIKQDQIDILIDLAGHTDDNRLPIFFSKPAPIQASYLGYFATTGIPTIDYWITDYNLHPVETEEKTSETIWRLPRCYVAYQPSPEALEINPLPALSSEHITFGCLNNFSKLNPFLLSLWAKILQALPQSRLILKSHYHNLDDTEEKQSVELFLQEQGFNLEQVELIDSPTLAEDYFALYHRIDIHLDTFPYNGCTTTCDALWMGVPVLTLAGDRKIQRMGNSLLQAIGLEDWIAHSPEEYVNKAIAFAQDLEAIAKLRTSLRERFQKSQLGDVEGLTLALENAYQQMWKKLEQEKIQPLESGDQQISAMRSQTETQSPLNYYSQYVQKNCPQMASEACDQLLAFADNTNWNQPTTLREWNNVAVIMLIEAEETQDIAFRKQLLNNAIVVLEQGKAHPLAAVHLALIYSLIGDYSQAYILAYSVFVGILDPAFRKTASNKGLVYLPSTARTLLNKAEYLEKILAAENCYEQILFLCAEVLNLSQPYFYTASGQDTLQLISQSLATSPVVQLQLGIARFCGQKWDGIFYLLKAHQINPTYPPSIQALYLAYRNLPEAETAEYWLQQGLTHFNPNSPDVGEWIWTQVKPENPFTYVPYDNLILTVEANLKSITTAVLLAQGDWFEAEMELWRIQIRPDMTVIDVGANVGVYTFSAAQRVGETGKVIAIEPFKACVNCLQETSRINQLPWVKIYEAAASDHCGSAKLSLHNASELNEVISDNSPNSDSANTVTIQCLTLDSLIETENLTRVDWLKIDAEGHEIQVLQGAERLLTEFKPNIIYENIAGAHGSNGAIMEYIQAKGYQVYSYRPYIQELVPVTDANQLNSQLNLIAVYNPNK
ncbi:MAG: FkbM family methyltransferase [Microcystis panniformis Mp_MB_F_20051200_S9]|uniref:FkbM family methyltransferase n=1 Tax=Microcystis panniformis Mp_MB_F_20051200_S9 TaxID=2486223 RepID=A0A552PVY5_9CHRO|nr:MAG: FkbM family methyltransferase [Microcystis panniformis Mp_MB_F_20080800_S26D]TRV53795.1 MAG: FkbM family methyltransferase [Microcystis panniformis Mp_GB_SS_20050300_S99D]TRV54535.1 MAG: FkbM family methyltransferase [Microcystis panniformis Mp_GB_SS_20050300_S99]TRV55560.1 MAG: FkbM family methyltransferase [Microcystis panniformis Mp_MB_F_20051200_S9D]TRV57485.1 MAG: FkbM family methyltransferase [Microcystis panniformis Mp_MB_F_20080800_S26]TRV61109.1 MAG: FkbM family methyltransfer